MGKHNPAETNEPREDPGDLAPKTGRSDGERLEGLLSSHVRAETAPDASDPVHVALHLHRPHVVTLVALHGGLESAIAALERKSLEASTAQHARTVGTAAQLYRASVLRILADRGKAAPALRTLFDSTRAYGEAVAFRTTSRQLAADLERGAASVGHGAGDLLGLVKKAMTEIAKELASDANASRAARAMFGLQEDALTTFFAERPARRAATLAEAFERPRPSKPEHVGLHLYRRHVVELASKTVSKQDTAKDGDLDEHLLAAARAIGEAAGRYREAAQSRAVLRKPKPLSGPDAGPSVQEVVNFRTVTLQLDADLKSGVSNVGRATKQDLDSHADAALCAVWDELLLLGEDGAGNASLAAEQKRLVAFYEGRGISPTKAWHEDLKQALEFGRKTSRTQIGQLGDDLVSDQFTRWVGDPSTFRTFGWDSANPIAYLAKTIHRASLDLLEDAKKVVLLGSDPPDEAVKRAAPKPTAARIDEALDRIRFDEGMRSIVGLRSEDDPWATEGLSLEAVEGRAYYLHRCGHATPAELTYRLGGALGLVEEDIPVTEDPATWRHADLHKLPARAARAALRLCPKPTTADVTAIARALLAGPALGEPTRTLAAGLKAVDGEINAKKRAGLIEKLEGPIGAWLAAWQAKRAPEAAGRAPSADYQTWPSVDLDALPPGAKERLQALIPLVATDADFVALAEAIRESHADRRRQVAAPDDPREIARTEVKNARRYPADLRGALARWIAAEERVRLNENLLNVRLKRYGERVVTPKLARVVDAHRETLLREVALDPTNALVLMILETPKTVAAKTPAPLPRATVDEVLRRAPPTGSVASALHLRGLSNVARTLAAVWLPYVVRAWATAAPRGEPEVVRTVVLAGVDTLLAGQTNDERSTSIIVGSARRDAALGLEVEEKDLLDVLQRQEHAPTAMAAVEALRSRSSRIAAVCDLFLEDANAELPGALASIDMRAASGLATTEDLAHRARQHLTTDAREKAAQLLLPAATKKRRRVPAPRGAV